MSIWILFLCSACLETESVCFHSLPFGFQHKIMVLPRVVQHFPGASAFADACNKPLFSQKQAGARHECTICVFCELYFLSYLMLIFLQMHGKGDNETSKPEGQHYGVVEFLDCVRVICLYQGYRNSNATIPEWVTNSAEGAFPVGRKSTKTKPGSATYVINNRSLKFSR